MTGVILGIVLAGLAFIAKWDRRLPMDGRAWAWTVVCALLEGAALREAAGDKPSALVLALAVTGGSLLLACVTDVLTCQVYNFTWWPALAAGAVSLGSVRGEVIVSLAVFWCCSWACLGECTAGRTVMHSVSVEWWKLPWVWEWKDFWAICFWPGCFWPWCRGQEGT